ncbi:unnamed protein product [Sphagnum tenellum]
MVPDTRDHKDGRKGEEAPSTRPSSSPALTRLQSHVATFMDEGTSSTIAATSVSNKMEEAEREIVLPGMDERCHWMNYFLFLARTVGLVEMTAPVNGRKISLNERMNERMHG